MNATDQTSPGPVEAPAGDADVQTATEAFLALFSSPTAAVQHVAREAGVAIAWQNRGVFEADLRRCLTEDEWSRLADEFDDYDEWLENSGAAESISYWRSMVVEQAGIDPDAPCPHTEIVRNFCAGCGDALNR